MKLLAWYLLTLVELVLCQSDGYTDENRPYKFGFNIQGHQHRKEEKDEKGIIKGEYGFITADGYYRVTVYATDENGDFKIISMKNYYVGFPPEDPTTVSPPTSAKNVQSFRKVVSSQSSSTVSPQTPAKKVQPIKKVVSSQSPKVSEATKFPSSTTKRPVSLQGQQGCSHCLIPTTTKKTTTEAPTTTEEEPEFISVDYRVGLNENFISSATENVNNYMQETSSEIPVNGQIGSIQDSGKNYGNGFQNGNPEIPNGEISNKLGLDIFSNQGLKDDFNPEEPNTGMPLEKVKELHPLKVVNPNIQNNSNHKNPNTEITGNRNSQLKTENRSKQNDPSKLVVGQVRDGLPNGITESDVKELLYTFNYTVGFHGHHEDGYRNGDKKGDYFFDGRDGTERRVEYIANEFGYQPNITLVELKNGDENIPHEKTEKDYGLKGYEFKWFYRK